MNVFEMYAVLSAEVDRFRKLTQTTHAIIDHHEDIPYATREALKLKMSMIFDRAKDLKSEWDRSNIGNESIANSLVDINDSLDAMVSYYRRKLN